LKKQKAKKGGATKKKDDAESSAPASKEVDDPKEDVEAVEDDEAAGEAADTVESPKKSHARAPSVSVQSKLRSESFRKEGSKSPAADGDPLFRVEELERENKRLAAEKEEAEKRWHKLEDELQELKEASGDSAGWLKQEDGQAAEVEKLVWPRPPMCVHAPINANTVAIESRNHISPTSKQSTGRRQTQNLSLDLHRLNCALRSTSPTQLKIRNNLLARTRNLIPPVQAVHRAI
jgi:hypothetical protein